jgi:hypothetical protein
MNGNRPFIVGRAQTARYFRALLLLFRADALFPFNAKAPSWLNTLRSMIWLAARSLMLRSLLIARWVRDCWRRFIGNALACEVRGSRDSIPATGGTTGTIPKPADRRGVVGWIWSSAGWSSWRSRRSKEPCRFTKHSRPPLWLPGRTADQFQRRSDQMRHKAAGQIIYSGEGSAILASWRFRVRRHARERRNGTIGHCPGTCHDKGPRAPRPRWEAQPGRRSYIVKKALVQARH